MRIGKYSARVVTVVNNGEKDIAYESTTTFWVLPWKILLGALLVLLFIFIGFYSTTKSIWNKTSSVLKKQ